MGGDHMEGENVTEEERRARWALWHLRMDFCPKEGGALVRGAELFSQILLEGHREWEPGLPAGGGQMGGEQVEGGGVDRPGGGERWGGQAQHAGFRQGQPRWGPQQATHDAGPLGPIAARSPRVRQMEGSRMQPQEKVYSGGRVCPLGQHVESCA